MYFIDIWWLKIADKTDHFGVEFVKINDKRIAKTYNILEFPALTFFKKGNAEPVFFTGDMENTEAVLEFMTSQQSMDNPDRIEEVNEKILKKLVAENNFVAVLFCESWNCVLLIFICFSCPCHRNFNVQFFVHLNPSGVPIFVLRPVTYNLQSEK